MKFIKKVKKGFALIFVLLIAAAMMIPVLMLLSSVAPRKTSVTGEVISDKVLALADSTVDNILFQINTYPFTVSGSSVINGYVEDPITGEVINPGNVDISNQLAQNYIIHYYIAQLNGGNLPTVPDSTDIAAINNFNQACAQISKNVSTYLYNQTTQEYYALWDSLNNCIAKVDKVGPKGDILSKSVKNLNSGTITNAFSVIDPNFATNNIWVEIDTNTDYIADKWNIVATAYLLSKPEVKRTVKTVASKGTMASSIEGLADGTWYIHDTSTVTVPGHSFADYSTLSHTPIHFGKYETTTGPIRSDANLYMGGWAKDPIFANNRIYDEAIDDFNGNHDGRFGADQKDLNWAINNEYANQNYPATNWANVDLALYGSNPVKNPLDPQGGLQDKTLPNYYLNGDATVVFNANGTVTLNGSTFPMPPNGAIFVEGTATVSGIVNGQCSVGASKINIGGNIIYNQPPRIDRNSPIPVHPDLLGLIAHGSITITTDTFNNHHHLQVDAAMISRAGSFTIDSNAPSHTVDPSGTYEGTWNGCKGIWDAGGSPAIYMGGNKVRGYEIQHTNYDWNLQDWGVPPFYPTTSNGGGEITTVIDDWKVADQMSFTYTNVLSKLSKTQLNSYLYGPVSIPGNVLLYYKYNYNGVDYYYGNTFEWNAISSLSKTNLYRISWREQIAAPILP